MDSLPLRFKFRPADTEMIHCLLCFVTNRGLPFEGYIKKADVYGKQEPWEIFSDTNEKVLYFITQLKRKTKKNKDQSCRFMRGIGNGTWKESKSDEIFDRRGRIMGYKRSLRYENKGSIHHGQWLMKEYCLPESLIHNPNVIHKGYAICQIKRKSMQGENANEIEVDIDDFLMDPAPPLHHQDCTTESSEMLAPKAASNDAPENWDFYSSPIFHLDGLEDYGHDVFDLDDSLGGINNNDNLNCNHLIYYE